MSLEDCIRDNAYRHEAKGLWWTEIGYDDRAAGSFRKALRNHQKADAFTMSFPKDEIFKAAYGILRDSISRNLFGAP